MPSVCRGLARRSKLFGASREFDHDQVDARGRGLDGAARLLRVTRADDAVPGAPEKRSTTSTASIATKTVFGAETSPVV